MKNITKISLNLLVICITLLAISAAALAIPDQYQLIWWTIDCGGGLAKSGDDQYALTSTIGQPDAGATLSGGNYDMGGGFFGDTYPESFWSYLPLLLR